MFTDTTLIVINAVCIAFLVVMLLVMALATRMRGGAGWASLIIVTTTVPVYLSNLTRDLATDNFLLFAYIGLTLNVLCMPALWLFAHSQLDKSFRLTARSLLHALPVLVSLLTQLVYYAPLSAERIEADRAFMAAGGENLPALVNDVILFGQFFTYATLTFLYIRKRKKYLQDNYSDSDYMEMRWTPRFLATFFALFLLVFVAYVINPRTDTWLIPMLNVAGMGYLAYTVIFHSTAAYLSRLPDAPKDAEKQAATAMSAADMKEICDKVTGYVVSTQAHKNSTLSLSVIAHEVGIHHKKISAAINGYLRKNFFEFVNAMRVEEAKNLLQELNTSDYTIESIYTRCGFNSRSSFFMTFKKFEGVSPAQWLKRAEKL